MEGSGINCAYTKYFEAPEQGPNVIFLIIMEDCLQSQRTWRCEIVSVVVNEDSLFRTFTRVTQGVQKNFCTSFVCP